VSKALDEVTEDMTLYHGVRLGQVIEAVYKQGQKDGAKKAVPHRNPGQPKKNRK